MKQVKSTKKSLFVATLLIVVLLVAAVATATYAWFMQNAALDTTSTLLVSAQADGPNLTIAWDDTDIETSTATRLTFGETAINGLKPACPVASAAGTAWNEATFFNGADINAQSLFGALYTSDMFAILTGATATVESFFIANNATAGIGTIDLAIRATITGLTQDQIDADAAEGSIASALRVAVFTRTDGSDPFLLAGILAAAGVTNTAGGTIVPFVSGTPVTGNAIADVATGATANHTLAPAGISLDADFVGGSVIEVMLVVWFDGATLVNENAGGGANVVFTFGAL
jgi:hypothetical protein